MILSRQAYLWPHPPRQSILLVLAGALGIFIGHPNPFFHFPLAALLTPFALFFLALQANTWKTAFFASWLAGAIGYSASLHWIAVPIIEVGQLPLLLAIPCVLLLGAYVACYLGLTGVLLRTLFAYYQKLPPSLLIQCCFALLFGLVYAGNELICGFLFTGFPWLPLATSFALWPSWIQIASVLGNTGETALLVTIACAMALALQNPKKPNKVLFLIALFCLSAIPLYGKYRLTNQNRVDTEPSLLIGMVQGNIDQNQKWEPALQQDTVNQYLQLSRQIIAENKKERNFHPVDLILWPETAMPFYYSNAEAYSPALMAFAEANRINLGFGTLGFSRDAEGEISFYNRFQMVNANGTTGASYDKVHLVPFGEYIPLWLEFKFIVNILQGLYFSPGNNASPVNIHVPDPLADAPMPPSQTDAPTIVLGNPTPALRTVPLGILICYETIFPSLVQQRVANGATLLVNVSNDAWFGKYSAPQQHLSLAIMRAVEQKRPILRNTNTGITTLIDAYGQTHQQSELFTTKTMLVEAYPSTTFTIYHHLKFVIELLCYMAVAVVTGGLLYQKYQCRNSNIVKSNF